MASAALVPALVAACGAPVDPYEGAVTKGQLVGHWKGDCGGTIEVAEDGTFRFDEFAYELIDGKDFRRLSGGGRWALSEDLDGREELELVHKRTHYPVEFIRDGDGLGLRYIINVDHEKDCVFSKKPTR
ncbi:hypothetical protein SPAR_41129 [Streptomyces sparsogenes DSM 40356]|uniref:Uncharacterized protein n=1 Tax=Streptomyces sparsogenes DSM 40356 TaxID=1331668 RepID=A0A1R1S5I7_9ACTN|nr:hypothetical protein SPAR_41129 [Streptomyces sparsogenes DSM 40356]